MRLHHQEHYEHYVTIAVLNFNMTFGISWSDKHFLFIRLRRHFVITCCVWFKKIRQFDFSKKFFNWKHLINCELNDFSAHGSASDVSHTSSGVGYVVPISGGGQSSSSASEFSSSVRFYFILLIFFFFNFYPTFFVYFTPIFLCFALISNGCENNHLKISSY